MTHSNGSLKRSNGQIMELPICYPDEIILSRLIRYITVTGCPGNELSQQILGSKRSTFHPFLPAGIKKISEFTTETAEQILLRQTLAPLFSYFMPTHSETMTRLLLSNDSAKAHRASQLPCFGSGSTLYLKWCANCSRDDIYNFGVAYWHRTHQIPGLNACPAHGITLSRLELTQRQRVLFGLLPKVHNELVVASKFEIKVSRFADEFLRLLTNSSLPSNYTCGYRNQLSSMGFVTRDNRIRRKKIMTALLEVTKSYGPSSEAALPLNMKDYRYFTELLLPRTNHHPFRHLIFATWLFASPNEFIKAIQTEPIFPKKETIRKNQSLNVKNEIEKTCLEFLNQGHSLNAIFLQTGKSRCYLKRLAIENAIPIRLKPKILTPECVQRVTQFARWGMNRTVIAKKCEISIGSVEQIISSKPSLVEYRRQLRWQSKRRKCKAIILRFRKAHPGVIRKRYQTECNQAYYWLYTNDKKWLESVLPLSVKPSGRHPS